MKDQLSRVALCALCAATAASMMLGAAVARAGTLTVSVAGVKSAKGVVRAGAYDAAGRQVAAADAPARVPAVAMRFDDLPEGRYGIRLYHDENGNGRLDKGAFGIPAEGYGFSNEAAGRFGVPAFDRMAVTVGAAPAETIAKLRY